MAGGPTRLPTLDASFPDSALPLSAASIAAVAATVAPGVVALTDATSIATDASLGRVFAVTLAGNRTLANPTNLQAGVNYVWIISQDASGSRTLAFDTLFAFEGAITPGLFSAANAVTVILASYDGTKLRATSNAERAVTKIDLITAGQTNAAITNNSGYVAVSQSGLTDVNTAFYLAADSADGGRVYLLSGSGRHLELLSNDGHVNINATNAVALDASLGASQISFWIDEATNTLKVKVKYSNGTTVKNLTTGLALS